jgi:hypothetical protein
MKMNGLSPTFFNDFLKIQVMNWVREILVTFENQSSLYSGPHVRFILNKINFCNKHPIIIQMLYFSNSNLIKFPVLYTLYMYNTDVLYLIISDWEDEPTHNIVGNPQLTKKLSTRSPVG